MTQQLTRIGDVVELRRRQVSVDVAETYEEIGIRSFGKGIFHKDPISGADLGTKRVYEIHPGDLVISNVFAWEGAIAVATAKEGGKIGSHRFMTFEMDSERATASYLRYYLLSDPGLSRIRAASPGSAGRNRTLGIRAFQDITIPLPAKEEQLRVADHLEAVEARVNSVVEDLGVARELYSRVASALVHRSDLSDSEKLSEGWLHLPVGQFISLDIDKIEVQDDAMHPMAGVYSFGKGLFSREDLAGDSTSYSKLHRLHDGQIVMSRLKGWEGALALVSPEFDGRHLSPEFPTFRVSGAADPRFVSAMFATEAFWSRLGRESTGVGARRERVHAEDLLGLDVWLPPLPYQQAMAAALTRLRNMANEARRAELLAAIMPSSLNSIFTDSDEKT
jgi:type I restriction enzyme, S subunit